MDIKRTKVKRPTKLFMTDLAEAHFTLLHMDIIEQIEPGGLDDMFDTYFDKFELKSFFAYDQPWEERITES